MKKLPKFCPWLRTVRFRISENHCTLETAVEEVQVLIRAKNGWTTKAIAKDLGMSEAQVAYRIKNGFAIGERARFRSGESWVAQRALAVTAPDLIKEIAKKVSRHYV